MNDSKMQNLKRLLKEFGNEDNYNNSDFNKGLYDGIELAIAILEDRKPNCRVYMAD